MTVVTNSATDIKRADADNEAAAAIEIIGAHKSFGSRTIFEGLDLTVAPGEFVALLGASGSGKTTLLRILLGLDNLDGGVGGVATPRSVVFQEPRLVPSRKVWHNVLLGVEQGAATKARALAALEEVGLTNHATAWPATLSGGEAQRVALARALIQEPRVLLLDEPFAALDALTRLKMQALVKELCRRHEPAVMLVTHDVEEAVRLADRVLVLKNARISVDIALEHHRTPERTAALKTRLYGELGVTAADHELNRSEETR
ncbi:MAG: ABC transporter ATP-binding protein [Mycobacterium sp.]